MGDAFEGRVYVTELIDKGVGPVGSVFPHCLASATSQTFQSHWLVWLGENWLMQDSDRTH